jgi:hypothetical protein
MLTGCYKPTPEQQSGYAQDYLDMFVPVASLAKKWPQPA